MIKDSRFVYIKKDLKLIICIRQCAADSHVETMCQKPYWRCHSSGTDITNQLHAHISMKHNEKKNSVIYMFPSSIFTKDQQNKTWQSWSQIYNQWPSTVMKKLRYSSSSAYQSCIFILYIYTHTHIHICNKLTRPLQYYFPLPFACII